MYYSFHWLSLSATLPGQGSEGLRRSDLTLPGILKAHLSACRITVPYRGCFQCRPRCSASSCREQKIIEGHAAGQESRGLCFRKVLPEAATCRGCPPATSSPPLPWKEDTEPTHQCTPPAPLHSLHLTLFIPQRMCPLTGGIDKGTVVAISGPKKVSIFSAHCPMAIVMYVARIKIITSRTYKQ